MLKVNQSITNLHGSAPRGASLWVELSLGTSTGTPCFYISRTSAQRDVEVTIDGETDGNPRGDTQMTQRTCL
jgi:hypothetical protein